LLDDDTAVTTFHGVLNGNEVSMMGPDSTGIAVTEANYYKICYCGVTGEFGYCKANEYWIHLTTMPVQGPVPQQTWTFSTNLHVRMEYHGYALNEFNTLRIVSDEDCLSNNRNPDGIDSSVFRACPNCVEMSSISQNLPSNDLQTALLTANSVRCNEMNEKCEDVYIRKIKVTGEGVRLEFTADPSLQANDVIVITSNVMCEADCTSMQLTQLQGTYPLAFTGSYDVGHRVSKTGDPTAILLPGLKFQEPYPSFRVYCTGLPCHEYGPQMFFNRRLPVYRVPVIKDRIEKY
jgi:hypothetical protein